MEHSKLSQITDNMIAIKPLLHKAFGMSMPLSADIAPGAYYVLNLLSKKGEISMSDIGKRLLVPKPNVTALVDKLISKNMVERLPDDNDRRIVKIKLTEEGIHTLEKTKKCFREQIKLRLSSLSEEELSCLSSSLQIIKDLLTKIAENK